MAVLGASRAYKDWQTANGFAEPGAEESEDGVETEGDAVPPPPQRESDDVKDYSDGELQALEDEDPLSLIDSLSTRVGPTTPSGVGASEFFASSEHVVIEPLTFSPFSPSPQN